MDLTQLAAAGGGPSIPITDAPPQVRTAAWLLEHLRVATAPTWYVPPHPAEPYNLREPIEVVQLRARDAALDRLRTYIADECYDSTPARPTPEDRVPFFLPTFDAWPDTDRPSDADRQPPAAPDEPGPETLP